MIAFKQYVSPDAVVQAQGCFVGVQFTGGAYSFFDPRTGELYHYFADGTFEKYRLTRLGQPMIREKSG